MGISHLKKKAPVTHWTEGWVGIIIPEQVDVNRKIPTSADIVHMHLLY
jgi:hypothetical protein